VTLSERLRAEAGRDDEMRARRSHPKGYEPGLEMDGDTGVLSTGPLEAPVESNQWADLLAVWGLDPARYEVIEPAQFRAWDGTKREADGTTSVVRLFYYRANVQLRTPKLDLLDLFKRHRRKPRPAPTGDELPAWGMAVGDLQLGEWNAQGGSEATVGRFYDLLTQGLEEYRRERKMGRVGGTVLLPFAGDCAQGGTSQGGRLLYRLDLTLAQQQQGVATMMTDAVEGFSRLADRVVLAALPGNHDEYTRAQQMRYDDSMVVAAAWAVRTTADKAGWGNVVVRTPAVDTDTITLDVQGTVLGMMHGHQWRGDVSKGHRWLADQAHGRTAIGDADVLLTAHRHHYYCETKGRPGRTVLCLPAVCGDSSYWVRETGQGTSSGAVTFRTGGGRFYPSVLSA